MPRCARYVLIAVLALGCYTRFVGLTRGHTDVPVGNAEPTSTGGSFYHFHPDETTLLHAARELHSPFYPPITAYGLVPVYLARGVLEGVGLFANSRPSEIPEPRQYLALRIASALLSVSCLVLVWLVGRRFLDPWSALLALYFTTVAPIAIQQAHFFTVDGLFTAITLAAFYTFLRAGAQDSLRWFVAAGVLIGIAGATRLNGLLLGLVLVAGLLVTRGPAVLRQVHPWLAAMVAAVTLLALQPYLATDPGILFTGTTTDDLHFSLQVARGEILRSWTVADLDTIPYLHYWTDLWPLSVGGPLTLLFATSIGYAVWRRRPVEWTVLAWVCLYFVPVGALHTKHVRYLLPLVPFLALLAADCCGRMAQAARFRAIGIGVCVVVALHAGIYGLAFSQLYTVEDSRIQAARWLETNVPSGGRIGVERGGFTMLPTVSQDRFQPVVLNLSTLFEARGYMSCAAQFEYLRHDRLLDLDYIAIIDVNRYAQYTAAPQLLPVAAGFYQRLVRGALGFELAARFKNYPSWLGFQFGDDGAEASFIGYDHPAVFILKRKSDEALTSAMEEWHGELLENRDCPDAALRKVARAFREDRFEDAVGAAADVGVRYPDHPLVHYMSAVALRLRGLSGWRATDRFVAGFENRASHVLPWASAMSFAVLDLPELAVEVVREFGSATHHPAAYHQDLSNSYLILANLIYRRGAFSAAAQVYGLSHQLHPNSAANNRLAVIAYRRGLYERAAGYWSASLRIDEKQAGIHANIGQILAKHSNSVDRARYHLQRAIELDPAMASGLAGWIADVGL
jgi:tetratricopeptide (TPR) repeat protein